jgi:hypothetical protein
MKKFALTSGGLAALLISLLSTSLAQAAPRTWVSSTGSGTTCSRAAPCSNFTTALTATDVGGEINCVDAGEFGSVIINKSVTIDCTDAFAGVPTNPNFDNGTAIIVSDITTVATIRGLSITGKGVGSVGVRFSAGVLHIENCRIYGFNGAGGGNLVIGAGIFVNPPNGHTSRLFVLDSVISDNGLPDRGAGILIESNGGTASTRVALERTRITNNTHGLSADEHFFISSSGSVIVQVRDSVFAGNAGNGIAAISSPNHTTVGIVVDRTSSVNNAGSGILAQGQGALVHLGNSTVIGNGAGLNAASAGQIFSYGNNQTKGNGIDGAPTGVLTLN